MTTSVPSNEGVAVSHPPDEMAGSGAPVGEAASAPVRARPLALAVLAATAAGAVAIDAITKQLTLAMLEDRAPVQLISGILYLNITRNPGAAFSIGVDYTAVFPIIAVVVLIGIGFLARRLRSVPWAVSMGLIVGGALGNLIDRLLRAPAPLHGHVVDFISVFDDAGRAFPIFNLADSALFCGVVLAIYLEFTGRRRDGGRESRTRGSDAAGGRDRQDGVARDDQGMMRHSKREP